VLTFQPPAHPAACRNVSYTSNVTDMEYYYFNCPAPYASASTTCQAMGGFLTSWTSSQEQADVEGYFISKVGCQGCCAS
jgi:hypothetical protein